MRRKFSYFFCKIIPIPDLFASTWRWLIHVPAHDEWLRKQVLEAFATHARADGKEANPIIMYFRQFRPHSWRPAVAQYDLIDAFRLSNTRMSATFSHFRVSRSGSDDRRQRQQRCCPTERCPV